MYPPGSFTVVTEWNWGFLFLLWCNTGNTLTPCFQWGCSVSVTENIPDAGSQQGWLLLQVKVGGRSDVVHQEALEGN